MERVVIAGDDGSAAGRAAVDWATREAELRGAALRVVKYDVPADAEIVVLGRNTAEGRVAAAASSRTVVLVPEAPPRLHGEVALGLDARDPAGPAVAFAFEAALVRGARLRAVHAWALPEEAGDWPFAVPEEERAGWEDQEVQLLSDALRPWRTKYPDVDVLEDVLLFPPAEALSHVSAHAELLVLGRRSGGTARSVLAAARCPVAVVPS
ncbi:universal stress protein [Streptomyces sp. NPDC019531]|uniref:universal stress protein n=1 Tax=Streptomyces sp. NPDC019531 TaxID=3365062 RepID=UPI00384AF22C